MAKRPRTEENDDQSADSSLRKTRRSAQKDGAHEDLSPLKPTNGNETPSKTRSILKSTPSKLRATVVETTPSSLRRVLFSTTENAVENDDTIVPSITPLGARNDRSARRKSYRTLQQQVVPADESDEEGYALDTAVAQAILDEDEQDRQHSDVDEQSAAPTTPSKTGRPRGRPKGRKRERTPSPQPHLPPHELYFFQNRAGGNKTSANTLPSHLLLNQDDYIAQSKDYVDPHNRDIEWLQALHKRSFEQWMFELDEGFNICLYGFGSKRSLLMDFADYLHAESMKMLKIVVANGYAMGLTIRDILTTICSTCLPKSAALPAQPNALLDLIFETLELSNPKPRITLIIHSLDHLNLRKPSTQSLLARLASHQSVSLLCSCDNPNFPLLWDVALDAQYNFAFHDATTFVPYSAEIEVVEDVNALLGRSSRRLGGKDGVGYVLKSLPENARNLFRILVSEQLALADDVGGAAAAAGARGGSSEPEEDILGVENDEEAARQLQQTPSKRRRGRPPKARPAAPKQMAKVTAQMVAAVGVEYRTLYHKAVEEFVCSSEVNFRTLLKEFHDHQMIESRKDALGTERLVVPFKREELESLLEED